MLEWAGYESEPFDQMDFGGNVLTRVRVALDVMVVFHFLRHWFCILLPVHGGNELRSQAF